MKNRAATFVKQILCVLGTMAKSKTMAIKTKTNAIRARLIVFSLLKTRRLSLNSVSEKIHALLNHHHNKQDSDDHASGSEEGGGEQDKAMVLYNAAEAAAAGATSTAGTADDNTCNVYSYYDDEDDKYPDLTHSLFQEEDDVDELDLGDPNASVIDLVRNSKEEGENFILEDEIDHVADLFILKFRKNIRMQKLESFKRYQEMLNRSA